MLVSKLALEAGRSVAIYSLPKLLAQIRRTYDAEAGEQSYSQFFERLTGVDLLHIDDLGAENRTEWVIEQLYALVNERYEAGRSLVVTTNLDDDELESRSASASSPPGRDGRRPCPSTGRTTAGRREPSTTHPPVRTPRPRSGTAAAGPSSDRWINASPLIIPACPERS